MDIETIIKAILPVDPMQFRPEDRTFRLGDHLRGRVLKLQSDGKVLMDFKTFRAVAEVPAQVQAGQTFDLEVTQTGNPLKLRIIPPFESPSSNPLQDVAGKPEAASLPQLLRQLNIDLNTMDKALVSAKADAAAATPQTIQSALKILSTLFAELDMTSAPKALAADLQNKVENSGFLFENKMAAVLESRPDQPQNVETATVRSQINTLIRPDFTPNAIRLLEFLDALEPKTNELDESVKQRIQTALKEIIEDVGQQKNIAARRLSTEDPFQIFHMVLPFAEKQQAAKLKVYYAKKKKEDPQSNPKVSLLLDLNNLGLVRSDFLMLQRDLSVTIYVGDSHIKDYVTSQIEPVRKVLEEYFEAVALTVRVSEKKIASFDAPLQMETYDHKVDLHI